MVCQRGQLFLLLPDADDPEQKQRPVVIISRDDLNGGHSVLAIPFYSQQLDKRRSQENCVFFRAGEGGLSKACVAKPPPPQLIRKTELDSTIGPIGRFNAAQMAKRVLAVRYSVRDDDLP